MDIRSFLGLSSGSAHKIQMELDPSSGLRTRVPVPRGMARHMDKENSSTENYGLRADGDLRSVVESRFLRMNELHDHIRAEILASRAPEISQPRSV